MLGLLKMGEGGVDLRFALFRLVAYKFCACSARAKKNGERESNPPRQN